MAVSIVLGAISTCAVQGKIYPEGVSITGYDKGTDYLSAMEDCARANTTHALILGAIFEEQRNMKIQNEGRAVEQTSFFTSFSGPEILTAIQEYKNPSPTVTYYTESDVTMLAKVAFCEGRGIKSQTELACVMWTILNRYDTGKYGGSIANVITAPNQFAYYSAAPTVSDYGYDLKELARDVLSRWNREKNGETDVGRVLPAGYCWYTGDGRSNYFRNAYRGGTRWNYSLPSPYAT